MHFPSLEGEARPRVRRKGFFARILEALHRSRRREAIRTLRRYRRLMAGQAQVRPAKPAPESPHIEKSSWNAHGNNTPTRADRSTSENANARIA
jgi:hypothetical protein